MANLINLMQNLFLSPLSYLRWRQSFGGFRSVPHLVDIYAKNADERFGNLCANAHYRGSSLMFVLKKYLHFTAYGSKRQNACQPTSHNLIPVLIFSVLLS